MIVKGYSCVPGANLRIADLSGANLRIADLSGADLSGANLYGANLRSANLSGANLRIANLNGANLYGADLSGANLYGANLRSANLRIANLRIANLSGADLYGADLSGANLSGANLYGADLSGANLYGANLYGADLSGAQNIPQIPWTIIVPEGDLIVYKKVSNGIAKLGIPAHAQRLNGTGRKCRASEAYIISCPKNAVSLYDNTFEYVEGTIITPKEPFCKNRWNECSSGIHFFLTEAEAMAY